MDMMSQMLNQMPAVAKPQTNDRPAANRNRSESGDDFDSLVRKKQEAAKAGESSGGNETSNRKSVQETSTDTNARGAKDAKPEQSADAEQMSVSGDPYMMAAAMLLQPQFVPMDDELPTVPAGVTEAAQGSELIFAAEGSDLPVAQFVPETPAEQQPQQQAAASGGETLIPQPEERSAVKMADSAEETAAPEFQRMVRQAAGELAKPALQRFAVKTDEEDDKEGFTPLFESAQIGTPVFEPMSAIPVKVAEPYAPVPLEAEDGVEQMGARIENLLTNENGDQTVELTLTPAELGTVRLSITHSPDGALHIQMSAANARAVNLLERGVASLQNQLMANNRPTVEIEVRAAENAQEQYLNPNDQQRNQQQQQQNRQRREDPQESGQAEDFLAKLRLEAL